MASGKGDKAIHARLILAMRNSCGREWCPGEDRNRALKQLISPANQQREIARTINSTIKIRGKGWISWMPSCNRKETRSAAIGGPI
jgi:hypothetical protein